MKNRELTYFELKNMVASTEGKELPTKKQLMESGEMVIAVTEELMVFANGFYIYTDGSHSTVWRVDKCDRLGFKKIRGEHEKGQEAEKRVYVDEA